MNPRLVALTGPLKGQVIISRSQAGRYERSTMCQLLSAARGAAIETVFLDANADLVSEMRRLEWGRFFVKDYVKSLKTSVGSIVDDPERIETVVSEMEKYRGFIEGGLCIRRVEDFIDGSERRYFVLKGAPYAAEPGAVIPEPVIFCVGAIQSPFFSVDVASSANGVDRIVEIGDGQVSDLVGWSVERFIEIWSDAG